MPRSRAITRRPPIAAVAVVVAAAAIVAGSLTGLGGAVAYLLPPLLLLAALVMRRYPGERMLLALMARGHRQRRCDQSGCAMPRSRPRVALPRGGCLIAFSLAVRPPPGSLAGSLS